MVGKGASMLIIQKRTYKKARKNLIAINKLHLTVWQLTSRNFETVTNFLTISHIVL